MSSIIGGYREVNLPDGGKGRYCIDRYGYAIDFGSSRSLRWRNWGAMMKELGDRVVMNVSDLNSIFLVYHELLFDRLCSGELVLAPDFGVYYPYYRVYGRDGKHGTWMVRFRLTRKRGGILRDILDKLVKGLGLREKLGLMERWEYGRGHNPRYNRYMKRQYPGDLDIGGPIGT